MTRQQAKNIAIAISFEDRVAIGGVHELIDQIYDEFEAREMLLATQNVYCNDCKHYLSDNGNFPIEPCGECNRFYADKFERKEDDLR